MRNLNIENNPVFESLYQKANKYTITNEQIDKNKYQGEKFQKYLKTIIGLANDNIINFSLSIPNKDIKNKVLGILSKEYNNIKTATPTSVDDIFSNFKKKYELIFSDTYINSDSISSEALPIYSKVKEGMDQVMKAYEELKEKYSSEISNPVTLKNCISDLNITAETFNSTLEELKKSNTTQK